MKTKNPVLLLIPGILLLPLAHLPAANITWDGSDTTNFGLGANWVGNVAPADSLTTDIGVFSGAVTANLPELTSSRSITGLNFSTTTGGWTFGSSSTANVLTLGASGINTNGQISGTNTISTNLIVGAGQTWNTGTGGTLKITGSVSLGTSGSDAAFNLTAGGAQNGTLVLDPGSGSSVNLYYTNASASAALQINKPTNFGSALNSTSSINVISNAISAGIRVAGGQTLTVNSGTWLTNDLGSNNTGALSGNVTLIGGSLVSGGGRYMAQFNGTTASTWTVNGGTLRITGGGTIVSNASLFGLGSVGGTPLSTTAINFNLQSGFVDVSKNANINQIGTVAHANAPMVLMNQTDGTAQFGVTTGTHALTGVTNANTASSLLIGNVGTATTGIKAAYTLTGGNLLVAGTLSGAAPTAGGGGVSNFNFMGGTLTAGTVDATNLTTSTTATASANQTLVSPIATATLHNYGGTLAPGGSIITSSADSFGNVSLSYAPTTGRTAITGGYMGHGGTSVLSFNLNGTTSSNVFQNSGSGFYSNATVSGTAFLSDKLVVSLLTGFTPAFTDSFTILTSGGLSGAFSNVAFGSTLATADGAGSFLVNQSGNNVTLTNFTPVPEASALGMLGILGLIPLFHRRRPAAKA